MVEAESEHKERRNSTSATGSESASREAQDEMRRQSKIKDKPKESPIAEIEDNSSVMDIYPLSGGPKRTQIDCGDGRSAYVAYGENGQPTKYRDFNGNVYEKRGDVWIDDTNHVQPNGVKLDIDTKTWTVKLTDVDTGIVRETRSSGLEITQYPPPGGKTTRQFKDGVEHISIESTNRPLRTMKIENDRLTQYTDGTGTTYTLTDQSDAANKTDKGKPYYAAVDRDGKAVAGRFTISADRTGNVVVRNEDKRDAADYARRELNNGTVVTSSADNSKRCVEDANGIALDPNSEEARQAQESKVIAETPVVDYATNVKLANEHYTGGFFFTSYHDAVWFYNQVDYGGPWDFKSPGVDRMSHPEYEAFGNWHYGYMGAAAGYSLRALQEEAGAAQVNAGTSKPEWGHPGIWPPTWRWFGQAPYGDDPEDAEQIRRGWEARLRDRQKSA